MKNTKQTALALSFFISSLLAITFAEYDLHKYTVSDTYSIKFETGKAEGTFNGLKGTVDFDPDLYQDAQIDVSVEVATIQTGNTKKDDHARNSKWFDVAQYPLMKFVATNISKSGESYIAVGNLTVKDVTKEISILFKYENINDATYLNGTTTINRKDYNINGNLFGFAVGKEVAIALSVPSQYQK